MSEDQRRSRRYSRESSRRNRRNNNEHVQEQAEVTVHVYAPSDMSVRRDNALSPMENKSMIYPGGADPANHVIHGGDIIYGLKRARINDSIVDGAAIGHHRGFATLNGISVEPYGTSENLNQNLYFSSVSKAEFNPNDPEGQGGNGVAGAVYGSRTVTNTFIEQGYPGDTVKFYVPNIENPKEITSLNHGSLHLSPTEKERITPVLKIFDQKDVKYNEVQLAMHALGLNSKYPNIPYAEIMENAKQFTPTDEASANLQHFIMSIVQSFYTVLSNRGIIQLTMEPTTVIKNGKSKSSFKFDPVAMARDNRIRENDFFSGETSLTTAEYADLKYKNDSEERYITPDKMEDAAYFQRREEEELFMGSLLGLITGGSLDSEDTVEVRNDILKTVFSGQHGDSLYFPLLAGLLETSENDPENFEPDQNALLSHYVKNMLDIPHNLHQSVVYLNKVTAGKIIGEFIKGALPGEQVADILFNGSSYRFA